jgi:hypothetical protein
MKNLVKSLLFFIVTVCSFNIALIQNSFAQSPFDATYNATCDGRCRGDLNQQPDCRTINDQNTCNNRYIISRSQGYETGLTPDNPYTCVWGQRGGNVCETLRTSNDTPCKCNRTYANPSKGIPDIRQRCSSGRVNYQGLCYIPCDRSYEMRSAGICTVKGL